MYEGHTVEDDLEAVPFIPVASIVRKWLSSDF
jgi:hypothetical protein